jgi:manganese-dependent ADP-ribose/CDP-alcohol diphosphatase
MLIAFAATNLQNGKKGNVDERISAVKIGFDRYRRNMGSPLFTFGIIADVQYANCEDGYNFDKSVRRYYRNSLSILREAVDFWNQQPNLSFIAQLGDLLDGINKGLGISHASLDDCLQELDRCTCKRVYHLIGNHDLYNFDRGALDQRLGTAPGGSSYYSFTPHSGWRFIILDSYDISVVDPIHPTGRLAARELLRANNPNDVDDPQADWKSGLTGVDRRFLPYNGALGAAQLRWLEAELAAAAAANHRAVILSHIPLHPLAARATGLAWNYDAVLSTLAAARGVVAAVFAGHDHVGGFAAAGDAGGAHHLTVASPLECAPGEVAYGAVDVYPDRLVVRGRGKVGRVAACVVSACVLRVEVSACAVK